MGVILEKTAYQWDFPVSTAEVDMFDRLKISALMKRQQEIGELHLIEFGTSSDKMRDEQGFAFIFTKMNIKVTRLPKSKENVTLTTWCSGLKGVRFTRNYVLRDEFGVVLTEAKAEVTAIDLNTRKIVRPREINGFQDFLYNEDLENTCPYPEKLTFFSEADKTYSRDVRFSDIDFNGHVNNTVYADISFDALPIKALENAIKGFEINFINEAVLGENIEVSVASTDDGWCVSGKTDAHDCFAVKLSF